MRRCGAEQRRRAVTGGEAPEAPGAADDTGFEPRSVCRGRFARVSLESHYEQVFQRNGTAVEPGKTPPWMRKCLRAGPSKR